MSNSKNSEPLGKPKLSIKRLDQEDEVYTFLDYGPLFADDYNRRWYIQWHRKKKVYYLVCGFLYTHETAIDNILPELALAKEAIDFLKKNRL